MNGSPCKDCPNRVLGCHSRCQSYQAYNKANMERNDKRVSYDLIMSDNEIQRLKTKTYFRRLKNG